MTNPIPKDKIEPVVLPCYVMQQSSATDTSNGREKMFMNSKGENMLRRSFFFLVTILLVAGCAPAAQVAPIAPTLVNQAASTVAAASTQVIESASTMEAAPTMASEAQTTPIAANSTTNMSVQGATTYTVLVGYDDMPHKADIEAYLPAELHIHVGDTVIWKQNAMEIHNVTFLAGADTVPAFVVPMPNGPAGAMMFNPQVAFPNAPKDGMYDGSTFATSGIMGKEQGQAPDFSLTFTKPGTYPYVCVIHNEEAMKGTVVVEDASAQIPSPDEASAQGQKELDALLAKVPDVQKEAEAAVKPAETNPDGSTTYYVLTGYSKGQIDLMSFFPEKLDVKAGDTVTWMLSPTDVAPHTVTFLNGAPEPVMVQAIPQQSGPPILTFGQDVVTPQNVDQPLTNQGIYNSGIIDPMAPGDHTFSLKIGDTTGTLHYICILHNEMGMAGDLMVQ
jgi:plastocyanin